MKISVLLPARNGSRTVLGSVRSTLAALPADSELLVFDDKSTDDTVAKLQSVNDSRLLVHSDRRSSGITHALNTLLERSKGEFVARMDADDICLPWRFKIQQDFLSEGFDFVFGNVVHFGKGMIPRISLPVGLTGSTASKAMIFSNPFSHPTMMTKRLNLISMGGYPICDGQEDYLLWLDAAKGGYTFARSAAPVLLYRHHSRQVTKTTKISSDSGRLLDQARKALSEDLGQNWADLAGLMFEGEQGPALNKYSLGKFRAEFGKGPFIDDAYLVWRMNKALYRPTK